MNQPVCHHAWERNGEALVRRNTAEAQEPTARYVGSAMTPEAVRAAWGDYEYRIKLDDETLALMVREGQWLKARGLVKEGEPTTALFRRWFTPEPLKSLDASRVSLAG